MIVIIALETLMKNLPIPAKYSGSTFHILHTDKSTMSVDMYTSLTDNKIKANFVKISGNAFMRGLSVGYLIASQAEPVLYVSDTDTDDLQQFADSIKKGKSSVRISDSLLGTPKERKPRAVSAKKDVTDSPSPKENSEEKPIKFIVKKAKKTTEKPGDTMSVLKKCGLQTIADSFDVDFSDTAEQVIKAVEASLEYVSFLIQLRINLNNVDLANRVYADISEKQFKELKRLL